MWIYDENKNKNTLTWNGYMMVPGKRNPGMGYLHVITGCMFAGKTEELIRQIRRMEYAKPKPFIWVFKPERDTRDKKVRTHYGEEVECEVHSNENIVKRIKRLVELRGIREGDVICFDEFQFFNVHLFESIFCLLLEKGINVILAGLSTDSAGNKFGYTGEALQYADKITHVTALCAKCGNEATKTQRKEEGRSQIEIGGADKYEARCYRCWEPR